MNGDLMLGRAPGSAMMRQWNMNKSCHATRIPHPCHDTENPPPMGTIIWQYSFDTYKFCSVLFRA